MIFVVLSSIRSNWSKFQKYEKYIEKIDFLDPKFFNGHKIWFLGSRDLILFLKWPSWTLLSWCMVFEPFAIPILWQKCRESWDFLFFILRPIRFWAPCGVQNFIEWCIGNGFIHQTAWQKSPWWSFKKKI